MAGHGLVQAESHHLPLRTRLRLVEVDVVEAGARAVRRAGLVVGGRRVRRDRVGDGRDAVWLARQSLEDLDEVRVDAFGRGAVGFEQVFGGLVVELLVRAQLLEELFERAAEADLLHDLLHLGAYARDLAQTFLVNLFGRHLGRRVAAREEGVSLGPVRPLPDADPFERGGQVLFDEILLQLFVSRNDALRDRFARVPREARAFGFRNVGVKLLEGFVEGAVFGACDKLFVYLRGDSLLDDLRPEQTLAHALAHE